MGQDLFNSILAMDSHHRVFPGQLQQPQMVRPSGASVGQTISRHAGVATLRPAVLRALR